MTIMPAPFTCVVVPADITAPTRVEEISTLEQMQRLVGGYVEGVNVDWRRLTDPDLGPGVHWQYWAVMWVNEEFLFHRELPFNPRASLLYPFSDIFGDVFISGAPDSKGDATNVPQEVIDLLSGMHITP